LPDLALGLGFRGQSIREHLGPHAVPIVDTGRTLLSKRAPNGSALHRSGVGLRDVRQGPNELEVRAVPLAYRDVVLQLFVPRASGAMGIDLEPADETLAVGGAIDAQPAPEIPVEQYLEDARHDLAVELLAVPAGDVPFPGRELRRPLGGGGAVGE